jgi:uncharacterized protein
MRSFTQLSIAAFLLAAVTASFASHRDLVAAEPVKILLITGGCCHDYAYQTNAMKEAFEEMNIDANWTVINEGGGGTKAEIDFYNNPDWAKGYDVVIHNECFADTISEEYIRKITQAHERGANAVVIHCAMHTYRASKTDEWRKFLGVTSRRHDHQSNYPVKIVAPDHPITQGVAADWVTAKDELYIIETVWPKTTVLATSVSEKDGTSHPVLWTNTYGEARIFGTTYGHSNETFADKNFRRALVQGIMWSAGKLK